MLPEKAGFPYPEKYGGASYFLLETHYDNHQFSKGVVDSSGLRLYLTPNVREFDAGALPLGLAAAYQNAIPPGVESFLEAGRCPGECTEKVPTAHIRK